MWCKKSFKERKAEVLYKRALKKNLIARNIVRKHKTGMNQEDGNKALLPKG